MAVALPFIGAAVGWGIGGTFLGVSAVSWGWFAGSLLASAVGGQHHRGPRLNDLNVVGTDYGGCIPWAAGSPRLAPQYAWASPMREIENTQKVGKGGGNKQTTYTYECDVGVVLTENVTEGVARDWVNSELIRNGLTTKDGVWEAVTVYTGEADQLPDPTYEAIYGAGNVSAFRGCTTIVIRGLQLGQGKQLPNLEHQVGTALGETVLAPMEAGPTTSMDNNSLSPLSHFEDSKFRFAKAEWTSSYATTLVTSYLVDFANSTITEETGFNITGPSDNGRNPSIGMSDTPLWVNINPFTQQGRVYAIPSGSASMFTVGESGAANPQQIRYAVVEGTIVYGSIDSTFASGRLYKNAISGGAPSATSPVVGAISGLCIKGDRVYCVGGGNPINELDLEDLTLVQTINRPSNGNVNVYSVCRVVPIDNELCCFDYGPSGSAVSLWVYRDNAWEVLLASSDIPSTALPTDGVSQSFAYWDEAGFISARRLGTATTTYVTYVAEALSTSDNITDPIPLNEVLEALLSRASYASSQISVASELGGTLVHGYATSSVTSTRAHLETLRPFGLYEANCSDKLYIRPRASTPVWTVEWSDLGAVEGAGDASDPFPLRLGNETEMPAQIAVRYRNVTADWNVGTEFSDRLNSSQTSTQVVEMAFGMTPAQAKALADTMLKDVMAGLGRATLRVGGRKYAKYEPGDVLETTSPQGRTYRFRILVKKDTIVMQEWDVVLDDASVLDTPGITYEGYVSTENPVRVAPTDWEVMAIRPLRDADASEPGPYVAVMPARTSDGDEWPGAVFVRARLPEAFEQVFVSGDVCTMGTCLTTLGDYSGGSGVVQRGNKLRVRVNRELSSAAYYDFFTVRTTNAAVIGNEPVRFIRADFVGMDGLFYIYDLSGFLRGQLGMESEIPLHVSGERFVLLDNSLRRMVNETTDIDQAQQVKAVTLNLLLDSVTDEEFTDDGIALRPLSPVHLRASHDSGDIDLQWIRRSRLVSRWTDAGVIAPLGELAESYRVKVFDDPGADPVRTVVVTSTEWTYSAADIASDGFTTGDPITFAVHQLSDMVGEGDAATLEAEAP